MSLIRTLKPFAGILIMVCASFAESTVKALAKLVSAKEHYDIPIFEVLFFITSFQIVPGLVALASEHFGRKSQAETRSSENPEKASLPHQTRRDNHKVQKFNIQAWILPVVGALTGGSVIVFQFAALSNMSLGNAMAVFWIFPAILYVLSVILGRERITIVKTLCVLLILCGTVLVIQPEVLFRHKEAETSEHESTSRYLFQHAGFALLAAFLKAISFISKRAEQKITPDGFIIQSIIGSVACAVWMSVERNQFVSPFTFLGDNGKHESFLSAAAPWIAILGAAVMFSACEFAQEKACVKEAVSTVGCIGALEVIFAFAWQAIMFSDIPDWVSALGASCIISGVVVLILRKSGVLANATVSRRSSEIDKTGGLIDEEDIPKAAGVVNEDHGESRLLV